MAKWSSGNYEKKYQKVKTWKTKNKSTKRELKIKLRRIKFEKKENSQPKNGRK